MINWYTDLRSAKEIRGKGMDTVRLCPGPSTWDVKEGQYFRRINRCEDIPVETSEDVVWILYIKKVYFIKSFNDSYFPKTFFFISY